MCGPIFFPKQFRFARGSERRDAADAALHWQGRRGVRGGGGARGLLRARGGGPLARQRQRHARPLLVGVDPGLPRTSHRWCTVVYTVRRAVLLQLSMMKRRSQHLRIFRMILNGSCGLTGLVRRTSRRSFDSFCKVRVDALSRWCVLCLFGLVLRCCVPYLVGLIFGGTPPNG